MRISNSKSVEVELRKQTAWLRNLLRQHRTLFWKHYKSVETCEGICCASRTHLRALFWHDPPPPRGKNTFCERRNACASEESVVYSLLCTVWGFTPKYPIYDAFPWNTQFMYCSGALEKYMSSVFYECQSKLDLISRGRLDKPDAHQRRQLQLLTMSCAKGLGRSSSRARPKRSLKSERLNMLWVARHSRAKGSFLYYFFVSRWLGLLCVPSSKKKRK